MSSKTRAYLLIARKDGSSSSRRQRAFETRPEVDRAISQWRAAGFNTWWLYGQRPGPTHQRPLLREWRDEGPAPTVEVRGEPIHPQTGEPTNEARAARLDEALLTYARQTNSTLRQDLLTDLSEDLLAEVTQDFLTDLFHWMHMHGLNPSEITQRAADMAQAEIDQEFQ